MPLKVITREGIERQILSPADFEKVLAVRYLSCLESASPQVTQRLKQRYERALAKGWITQKQKWLGHYYAAFLKGGLSLDLRIAWIDPRIGYGVFTERPIPKGAYVGEYTGVLRRRLWFSRWENLYCFDYTIGEGRSSSHVIDASLSSNHTRFINHSEAPNLELVSVDHAAQVHVILYASRPIAAGEQLFYDYGDEYWRKRPPPVPL